MGISATTFALLLTIIGILVGIVNIIVQVLKKITWEKIPTSLLAFAVSQVVTILALIIYCTMNCIVITWYFVVGAIVVGFMVAYSAMFGFDKLKEIMQAWTGLDTPTQGSTETNASDR